MAVISWGKCELLVGMYDTNGDGSIESLKRAMKKLATPVNGSTSINIEEGEKHEAEIEGGGNEAVKYDKDKFSIEFDIRRAKGRATIGTGGTRLGQLPGEWALALQAEDPTAPSILVERSNIKHTLSYTSTDGIYDHYVVDALEPKEGDSIKIGLLGADDWQDGAGAHTKVKQTFVPGKASGEQGEAYALKFMEDEAMIH